MALYLSYKHLDDNSIQCGCPTCRDLYGDTLILTTSGLVPCECADYGTGFGSTYIVETSPNGAFEVLWDNVHGYWFTTLGSGHLENYENTEGQNPDGECNEATSDGPELLPGVIIRCIDNVFTAEGNLVGTGVLDEGISNEGLCPSGTAGPLFSSGAFTISLP